jgi:hypothetical protein
MTVDTKNWVPDWALDMARVPFDPNAERAAANFSTGGPTGMIPRTTTAPASAPPANTSGWQNERPLGTQPGIDLIDRMCINADQRERQQAQRPDFMEVAMQMLTVQSQQIATLAALVMRKDKPKPTRRPKHERRQHR